MVKQHVGLLALQGDYAKHREKLDLLGVSSSNIRHPSDLDDCTHLIIPGGETTTMTLLMQKYDLYEPIRTFAEDRAVWGTCAGLIMVARETGDRRVTPLNLIDISVKRNAYGRQVESFVTEVPLSILNGGLPFKTIFIRAPVIESCGSSVQILGTLKDHVVLARNERILVSSFHPELTHDLRLHTYFLQQMK